MISRSIYDSQQRRENNAFSDDFTNRQKGSQVSPVICVCIPRVIHNNEWLRELGNGIGIGDQELHCRRGALVVALQALCNGPETVFQLGLVVLNHGQKLCVMHSTARIRSIHQPPWTSCGDRSSFVPISETKGSQTMNIANATPISTETVVTVNRENQTNNPLSNDSIDHLQWVDKERSESMGRVE